MIVITKINNRIKYITISIDDYNFYMSIRYNYPKFIIRNKIVDKFKVNKYIANKIIDGIEFQKNYLKVTGGIQ